MLHLVGRIRGAHTCFALSCRTLTSKRSSVGCQSVCTISLPDFGRPTLNIPKIRQRRHLLHHGCGSHGVFHGARTRYAPTSFAVTSVSRLTLHIPKRTCIRVSLVVKAPVCDFTPNEAPPVSDQSFSSILDMDGLGQQRHHHLPVVFLGLLSRLLPDRDERVHRKSSSLRPAPRPRRSISWLPTHPGSLVQFLPDGICLCHGCDPNGRYR